MANSEDYNIRLKPGAVPYSGHLYSIPKAHEDAFKQEVSHLCKEGVMERVSRSEWGSPGFMIPKKDRTVRFLGDYREVNKRLVREPFPIPKIQDLLLGLEGFMFVTTLDLNMGYYHIELSPFSQDVCTIVLPWGKYRMKRLPMGLCNSPDIFQEKMASLMDGLQYVRTYIDDLLVFTKGTWEDHLEKLEKVLKRLQEAGLRVNARESHFGKDEVEYLGFQVNREGIKPMAKKVEAIQAIKTPKTKKELRKFIGMINYYRDMWRKRSEVLAPLASLTSDKAEWKWTNVQKEAFETIKGIISRETLLAFPNFRILCWTPVNLRVTPRIFVSLEWGTTRAILYESRRLYP